MKTLLALTFFMFTVAGMACSCVVPEVEDAYKKAKVVLTGMVIRSEVFVPSLEEYENDSSEEYTVTPGLQGYLIEIDEIYKGRSRKKTIWILQSMEPCGPGIHEGQSYLFYLREYDQTESMSSKAESSFLSSPCFRTMHLEHPKVKNDLAYMKKQNDKEHD